MNNNYQQTLDYLFSQLPMYQRVGSTAFKKDLTNTFALCEENNNPHEKLKCIHVGGTNGKGSVSHIIAAVLQENGYKVGLYTSPHYKDFRERIKINGEYISEEDVINFTEKNKEIFEEINPSFFEMTVVMAFDYFAKQEVDYAVIEVGLGGRLDSTNVIRPLLSIITNISFDHTDMLGNTLPEIAFEKAGIIKNNVPVIIGETNEATKPVFENTSREKNAPIQFAEELSKVVKLNSDLIKGTTFEYTDKKNIKTKFKTDLIGNYQLKNLNTALSSLYYLKENNIISISDSSIENGIQKVKHLSKLIGRFQVIQTSPTIILDSAHNEGGLRELFNELEQFSANQLHIVFGTVKDKDLSKVLPLLPKKAKYYFCKANIPRGLEAEELLSEAAKYSLNGDYFLNVATAFNAAVENAQEKDIVLVTGSIFVAAEVI
jgi:dihydrofolate synthase / folylpolyglutamate synthase